MMLGKKTSLILLTFTFFCFEKTYSCQKPNLEEINLKIIQKKDNQRKITYTITHKNILSGQGVIKEKNGKMNTFYNSRKNPRKGADKYFKDVQLRNNVLYWQEFGPRKIYMTEEELEAIKNGQREGQKKELKLLEIPEIKRANTFNYEHYKSEEAKFIRVQTICDTEQKTETTRHQIPQDTFDFIHKEQQLLLLIGLLSFSQLTEQAKLIASLKQYVSKRPALKKSKPGPMELLSYNQVNFWRKLPDNNSILSMENPPKFYRNETRISVEYINKK